MTIRVAINGFGRIGRTIARLAKLRDEFDIVAHETGPSWSVRATTDGFTTSIKRITFNVRKM